MAGKHSKRSRIRSAVAKRGGTGLAAAAVSATSVSTAFVTGTTPAISPAVELMALVTPANSTSQFFAGRTYYGTDYTQEGYGPQQVVPFFLGPQGIANAISDADGEPIVVLASGWGAGQTGTALGILDDNDDPALNDIDLVILDNNTNRAGGGFWTTYYPFAPLLLTSAEPTPSDLDVPILDVGYEYNINGNAPVDPLNPFALGNSLAAYVYGYGGEQTANVPQEAIADARGLDADPDTHYHYVLEPDGTVISKTPLPDSTTTYVTFDSGDLPLTRPLRLLPGGDILADALDPTLTELVNAGYNDGLGIEGNEAIPEDPTVPRPMQPGSSLGALGDVPDSVQDGLDDGIDTAQDDISAPGNFVTKPLDEFGQLPGISSLPTSTFATTNITTTGNKVTPEKKAGSTSSTSRPRPLKKMADNVSSSLKKLAGDADNKKPAESENDE